MNKTLEMF